MFDTTLQKLSANAKEEKRNKKTKIKKDEKVVECTFCWYKKILLFCDDKLISNSLLGPKLTLRCCLKYNYTLKNKLRNNKFCFILSICVHIWITRLKQQQTISTYTFTENDRNTRVQVWKDKQSLLGESQYRLKLKHLYKADVL